MKAILLVLLFFVAGIVDAQHIVILHTNDTHSQIEPIRVGEGKGRGGVHRRGEYLAKVRKENPNVIILDAGDYNQGTPYFTVFKGDIEVEVMNALGYDAVCLGNHEFDNGQKELARRLSNANFPTLCANYDFTGTPLEPYIKKYVIIERDGKKIGIIGLIRNISSVVISSSLEGMKYKDAITVGNEMAAILKEKGCDLIIALTHIGFSARNSKHLSDISLAQKSKNIDIIIGGHSHTFLKSERVYKNLDGKDVVVVQDGAHGEYVGRFDINFL